MIDGTELQRRSALWEQGYWEIPDNLDTTHFDFNWRPDIYDRPFIHQFGTQWQKTGGPRFIIPGNENNVKFQDCQQAIHDAVHEDRSWRPLVHNATIDFSWHPDDTDPPFIYVFGNQWYDVETMPTFQYRVKGATQKKFMHEIKATLLPDKSKWIIPEDISEQFDYSWIPHPHEPPYMWQFGTQWQQSGGPCYVADNATYKKYSSELQAVKKYDPDNRNWRPLKANISFDYSWHPDENEPPFIYVFGNQWHSAEKMPTVMYRVKGATEKKYVDALKATLLPNKEQFKSLTDELFEFDYSWTPDPYEPPFTYVFGNQWHNSIDMPTLMYTVKGSVATKYIEEVKATLLPDKTQWIIPEDIDDSEFDYSWVPNPCDPPFTYVFGTQWQRTGGPKYVCEHEIGSKFVTTQSVTKLPNMRNWRIIEPINKETFDFSWHPDDTEDNYSYIFGNKFHTPEIMPTVMYKSKGSITHKFSTEQLADLLVDKITYTDSIFDSAISTKFSTAYAHFVKGESSTVLDVIENDVVSVHLLGDEAIVPRCAKIHLYDKLTDYDHVVDHGNSNKSEPLDIIFISNGEAIAEENYLHLLSVASKFKNRVKRVDGVKGREESQHVAANISETPWYFLVNAKLRVNESFDFDWQPNIYKSRRHYIFTATNTVNGLEYGHQAIVANNKILTLSTVVRGLDFTMDSRTEVIDINSGIARYNTSEWDAWRTSFRECVKLAYAKDSMSKTRLEAWLNNGNGDFAEYSIKGAKDALHYCNEVNGDLNQLKLSYEWQWLSDRFTK